MKGQKMSNAIRKGDVLMRMIILRLVEEIGSKYETQNCKNPPCFLLKLSEETFTSVPVIKNDKFLQVWTADIHIGSTDSNLTSYLDSSVKPMTERWTSLRVI
ncbi:MAG: hypothetical protein QW253_03115 [Metallosphaera sp.]